MRTVITRAVCLLLLFAFGGMGVAMSQSLTFSEMFKRQRAITADTTYLVLPWIGADEVCFDRELFEVIMVHPDSATRPVKPLAKGYLHPVVFDSYQLLDSLPIFRPSHPSEAGDAFNWLDDVRFAQLLIDHARLNYVANNPIEVPYQLSKLPVPPKDLGATVGGTVSKIDMNEFAIGKEQHGEVTDALQTNRINWIRNFDGSVHFSQTYVSPNWYQGGNNNVIILVNALYNVKLNQKFYPKLLFDTSIQYKLGLSSAPDDSIRSYNISEDRFQITSTFGYKAANHWYYSANFYLKTQFLNNYASNSRQLKAAFMSPGEINLGLGMTYSFANPKKTFTVNASIAPLSWNMKTCIHPDINETSYGIREGHKTVSQYGSSGEVKVMWKVSYNITYSTRFFAFTDYDYYQSDWEQTVSFDINRYLSTAINVNLRFDTSTSRLPDSQWHRLQLKEILSFGFQYKFQAT